MLKEKRTKTQPCTPQTFDFDLQPSAPTFTFDETLTPTVTGISPSNGTTETEITITGEYEVNSVLERIR